jgi:hypothetical protein
MASIQLRDGSTAEIPDGLSPDAMENYATRAQAAYDAAKTPAQSATASAPSFWDKVVAWGNQTPAQALGFGQSNPSAPSAPPSAPSAPPVDPIALMYPPDTSPRLNAAANWIRTNIGHSAPVNFAANVGADIAALPWDAPASISNAILHTAQNYGYAPNEPSMSMAAPWIKGELGTTPSTDPWMNRAETAAQIAATGEGSLTSRLLSGIFGEAKGEVGSYAGGKIADVTDPRLREGLETAGSVAAQGVPENKIGSWVVSRFGNNDAKAKYDAAKVVQGVTGADQPPVTAGQLGGGFMQTIENLLGKIPFTGTPIHSAQADVQSQIEQAIQKAAGNVAQGAPVSTATNAPGDALLTGVREHVDNALNTAKPQIDDIEKQLGTRNTLGPGGGSAMVDPRGLVNELNGMKTATDAAGNARTVVDPQVAAQIDAEIAKINSVRQPEDPALHAQLQSQIGAMQKFLSQSGIDPVIRAQVETKLQMAQGAQNANMKVPFEALRQMKTRLGESAFGPGTRSLDDVMDGKVYGAYGDAIQGFANQLDPGLGKQYSDATGAYSNAMDLQRTFKKVTQGANEQGLTSTMTGGLTAPTKVQSFSQTPGMSPIWNQAAANTIAMLGRKTPGSPFNVNDFAQTWGGMTPEAKALYARGSPDMVKVLDAAATLGQGFDPTGGRKRPVTSHDAIFALLADRLLNGVLGEKGAAATTAALSAPYAASAGIESGPFKRALAGRSTPYSVSLPAIMAVAQQQGRNQGY